jgi:transposase InsO family protein
VTVIDSFSRLIVAWTVVPTVTQREVQALVAVAVLDQHLDQVPSAQRPKVRLDRGAPNTATVTKEVLHDLGLLLSLARPQRPTDNGRQERWYRTLKQEEVYVMADYIRPFGALRRGRRIRSATTPGFGRTCGIFRPRLGRNGGGTGENRSR